VGRPVNMVGDSDFTHRPVMEQEICEVMDAVPAGVVLDATLGAGGHSEALLRRRSDLQVLGLDQDPAALEAARHRLSQYGSRVMTHRCRFDHLRSAMAAHDIAQLSGALFDLGVSSPQLDQAGRGFSFRHDGPLDMRMDTDAALSAADVVNDYSQEDLARVIRTYGDERFAARIAKAIVAQRPITSTTHLAQVVTTAIPAAARRTGGHPAKRTFQAIRIEVNSELDVLPQAIDDAIHALAPGGRIAVLSYHSGEDRIVKGRLRAATGECSCPHGLPCVCGAVQQVALVRRIPRTPSSTEITTNSRAASARLRVAQKVASDQRERA
jgi:16S rRNA (cytosine1402-N4)-methyltransferase